VCAVVWDLAQGPLNGLWADLIYVHRLI